MDGGFLSWGLPIGTVAGVRLRIHWSLFAFWLYQLDTALKVQAPLSAWLLAAAISFVCIVLHEFGHCFAARAVGGSADEILLWPLGGLASVHVPNRIRPQLLVAAAGPLVTFALVAAAYAVSRAYPPFSASSLNYYIFFAYAMLVTWQATMLVFNVLPLYPLDGGRIFHMALWAAFRRFGRGYDTYLRATMITLWVARVLSVLGVLYGLYRGDYFLVFLFIWTFFGAERLRAFDQADEESQLVLGHDFSQGYTSLERTLPPDEEDPSPRPSWWRRLLRKAPRPDPPPAPTPGASELASDAERQRVDWILAKISRSGLATLTPQEREFLKAVSRRWSGEK
jgi:Zn-dependent protease